MRIAVLGPLEVLANDSATVVVPGAQERLLLGVLPQDAILSGGRTVTFGIGDAVVGWTIGVTTPPSVIMDLSGEVGASTVVAPSTVEDMVMGAGG
jgi:hypothetical protein